MKYLKTFEHFAGNTDYGDRFSGTDADEQDWLSHIKSTEENPEDEECEPCGDDGGEEESEEDPTGLKSVHRKWYDANVGKPKVWGDEVVEGKKAKPDFLDLDKDGDKKESMKKAAKDAKEKDSKKEDKKKEDKEDTKGLSASQKKLPAGLQKAILAKKKK